MTQRRITDNLENLLEVLPPHISRAIEAANNSDKLIEIVMDLGRLPMARFIDSELALSDHEVLREEIDYVVERIGDFDADNRAGLERTLHRISAIRNRRSMIVGLTCRVGRAVYGTIDILQDLIDSGKSLLILGQPGIGKTTILRETARTLAESKRVVIVDTSNEIGGDDADIIISGNKALDQIDVYKAGCVGCGFAEYVSAVFQPEDSTGSVGLDLIAVQPHCPIGGNLHVHLLRGVTPDHQAGVPEKVCFIGYPIHYRSVLDVGDIVDFGINQSETEFIDPFTEDGIYVLAVELL